MTWSAWLTIVGICCLGAMSPGPSLAVVLKHTLSGGRREGAAVALAHGLGVGIYAFACLSGLAVAILTSEALFEALRWSGAAYLAWLGVKGLMARAQRAPAQVEAPTRAAARDGFLIVLLNPKIAVFLIALFSQVIDVHTPWWGKLIYAATAMIIDGGWYLIVAWLLSAPRFVEALRARSAWIERLFGAVLLGLAGKLALGLS